MIYQNAPIFYAQVVNTAIGLLLQQEYIKLGEVLTEKKMPTTAICFGQMVFVNTALKKIIYTELVVQHKKYKSIYEMYNILYKKTKKCMKYTS